MKYLLPLLLLISMLSACDFSSDKNEQKGTKQAPLDKSQTQALKFEAGRLYKKVNCTNLSQYSYALYLPKTFADSLSFPVVYFFDAHAEGELPVKKYQRLADEFSCILVGSNDSKNGLNQSQIGQISMAMIRDVKARFHIQGKAQFAGGFSGGARVAVQLADRDKELSGVMGFGAGLPTTEFAERIDFDYVFAAGKKDFNYPELYELDTNLAKHHIQHLFISHAGKHEWPNDTIVKTALFYLFLKSDIRKKDSLVDAYQQFEKSNLQQALNTNDMIEQRQIYLRISKTLNEIDNTIEEERLAKTLKETKQYNAHERAMENAFAYEAEMKENLKNHLYNNDIDWWNKELRKIKEGEMFSSNMEMSYANSRLKAYLGIATYMFIGNALKNNQLTDATTLLHIYQTVEPENPEVYFLKALMYARKNNHNQALLNLEEAAKFGFKDMNRIYQEPAFQFSELELDVIQNSMVQE